MERDVCAFHGVGGDSAEDKINENAMSMYPILKHGALVMYRYRSLSIYIVCFRLEFFYYKPEKRLRKP